jgi:hypothetical protein
VVGIMGIKVNLFNHTSDNNLNFFKLKLRVKTKKFLDIRMGEIIRYIYIYIYIYI